MGVLSELRHVIRVDFIKKADIESYVEKNTTGKALLVLKENKEWNNIPFTAGTCRLLQEQKEDDGGAGFYYTHYFEGSLPEKNKLPLFDVSEITYAPVILRIGMSDGGYLLFGNFEFPARLYSKTNSENAETIITGERNSIYPVLSLFD